MTNSTDNNLICADITARGVDSCVPDNGGAVDAYISWGEGGVDVTLIPNYDGDLDVWGSVDNWAADPAAVWALELALQRQEYPELELADLDGIMLATEVIVEAVRFEAAI